MAQISGPLGETLGRDPVTFAMTMARSFTGELAKLCARVAKRKGMTAWTVTKDGKRFTIPLTPSGRDAGGVARALTAWAVKAPRELVDEAARQAMGLPVAPRSLSGDDTDAMARQYGQQWGTPEAGEPITIMAILTIAIPLLVSIAPTILGAILAATGLDGGGGIFGPKEEPAATPPPSSGFSLATLTAPENLPMLGLVALVVVVIVRSR